MRAEDIKPGEAYVRVVVKRGILSRLFRWLRPSCDAVRAAEIERRMAGCLARCDARREKIERRIRRHTAR